MATNASSALGGGLSGGTLTPGAAALVPQTKELAERAQKSYAEITAKRDANFDRLETDISRQTDRLDKERTSLPEMTPMPKDQVTDPVKAWGSAAMIFAMVGSALTRTPMTTALNAAAATLKSFHEGDIETSKLNFERWKVSSENALKMHEFVQKEYDNILNREVRQKGEIDRQFSGDLRAKTEELKAFAHSITDQMMLQTIMSGGYYKAEELQLQRGRNALQVEEHTAKIDRDQQARFTAHANVDAVKASAPYRAIDQSTPAGKAAAANMVNDAYLSTKGIGGTLTQAQLAAAGMRARKEIESDPQLKQIKSVLTIAEPIVDQVEYRLKNGLPINSSLAGSFLGVMSRIDSGGVARKNMVELNVKNADIWTKFDAARAGLTPGDNSAAAKNQFQALTNVYHGVKDNIDKIEKNRENNILKANENAGIGMEYIYPDRAAGTPPPSVPATSVESYAPPEGLRADPGKWLSHVLGYPVRPTSIYRNPATNKRAGGSPTSEHMQQGPGVFAVDFPPDGRGLHKVANDLYGKMRAAGQSYDQILIEPEKGIVHIGFGPKNRNAEPRIITSTATNNKTGKPVGWDGREWVPLDG